MPTPPKTKNLWDVTNKSKPNEVSKALLGGAGQVESEDCPWVKIGAGLYVSVTITGENSWGPLVAKLYSQGARQFTVFTGRHGNLPNYFDGKTKETRHVFDQALLKQDQAILTLVKSASFKEFYDEAFNVDIVDAGKSKKDQTTWLKSESNKAIKAGSAVIWAWCYGLFTMFEFEEDAEKKMVHVALTEDEIAKPIDALCKTHFAWVQK